MQRGSIHCHGLAKLKDDPGLCELTKLALHGYLEARKRETIDSSKITSDDLCQIETDILNGKKAEKQVCDYVDHLISTNNPLNPDENDWIATEVHPCKLKYTDIEESEWDDDYVNLLNTVQRHSKCNSAYCLRQKSDGKQNCRFDFPINKCDSTHIEFENVPTKDGAQR